MRCGADLVFDKSPPRDGCFFRPACLNLEGARAVHPNASNTADLAMTTEMNDEY